MTLTVWGIPTCGTVKKARAWLQDHGHAHTFHDLRATPPSSTQIAAWARAFGVAALKNTSGGSYRALPADKDAWSDERWLQAFADDPMLLRRPIVEQDGAPLQVGWRTPPLLWTADARRHAGLAHGSTGGAVAVDVADL